FEQEETKGTERNMTPLPLVSFVVSKISSLIIPRCLPPRWGSTVFAGYCLQFERMPQCGGLAY
ncbi:MAG: hypothetical protein WEA31_05485, partial [Pirellulales bacterium]